MPKRSYGEYCGIAHALDLVGERWALLVVRELVVGPKRFTDLLEGLPGIGTNVLTDRIKELERVGLIQQRLLPRPAATKVYELTAYGRELEQILLGLARWGAKSIGRYDRSRAFRTEWLAIPLRGAFRPARAGKLDAVYEIVLGETAIYLAVRNGHLDISNTPPGEVDVRLKTDVETFFALWSGALSVKSALARRAIRYEGDTSLLERFVEMFPRLSDVEAP